MFSFTQSALKRGPTCIQTDLLWLRQRSRESNSCSQINNIAWSAWTGGDKSKMSSAYSNTLVHINERLQPKPDLYIFLTTSSTYIANKQGDSATPCLTSAKTLKKCVIWPPHLTHVEARANQHSTSLSNRIGTFLAINIGKKSNMINFIERFGEI